MAPHSCSFCYEGLHFKTRIKFSMLARPDYGKFLQKCFQNIPKMRGEKSEKESFTQLIQICTDTICPAITWESDRALKERSLLRETEVWQPLAFLHRYGGHCSDRVWPPCMSVWWPAAVCSEFCSSGCQWAAEGAGLCCGLGVPALPARAEGDTPRCRRAALGSRWEREGHAGLGASLWELRSRRAWETVPLGNGALLLHLREPSVQADAGRGAGAMSQLRFLLQTGINPWL